MKLSYRTLCWLQAGAWLGLIYSTLSIVRPLCELLRSATPFLLLINMIMTVAVALIIIAALRTIRLSPPTISLLLVLIACYVYTLAAIPIPEEKIHFLEYGILAFLVYRALRIDMQGVRLHILVAIITVACGWGDEIIQYFLPNRYYDTRDVIFNAWGGVLGIAVTYLFSNTAWKKKRGGETTSP